jgi:hypothetical protein
MAVEPSVAPVQAASPAAATKAPGGGGRFTSNEPFDAMSGSPFVSLADQLRIGNDQNSSQGGANQWSRGSSAQILFTPRVSLAAATFPAISGIENEEIGPASPQLADREHGVGIYELYMRITSGSARNQGSVINFYS